MNSLLLSKTQVDYNQFINEHKKELLEYFNTCITKREDDCWIWKNGTNYGMIKFDEFYISAHRLSYILFKTDLPDYLLVCHSCDNPPCVNPKHLFLGTNKDNAQDRSNKLKSKIIESNKNKVIELKSEVIKFLDTNFLTVKEVSTYLQVTEQVIYKYIKSGRIKAVHIGEKGTWRIKENDINSFVNNNQN